MNVKIQNDLNAIVAEITALIPDAKVILFGSYAKGTEHEDSDLDLCVVGDAFTDRRIDMTHIIRRKIRDKTKLPLDIIVYHVKDYDVNSKKHSRLEYNIATEGVVLND
jgi:predicted nucleotidyltransferase